MVFGGSLGEEAVLADVEVEAAETPVSETDNREHFTDITFCLVFSKFGGGQAVHDREPNEALWF